jgi:hypothetical protein
MKLFTQVIFSAYALSIGGCGAWSLLLSPQRTTIHQQRFTISGRSSGTNIQLHPFGTPLHVRMTESTLRMTESSETPSPTTFREAEVLGLRLMQEGNYQEALDGTLRYIFFFSFFLGGRFLEQRTKKCDFL